MKKPDYTPADVKAKDWWKVPVLALTAAFAAATIAPEVANAIPPIIIVPPTGGIIHGPCCSPAQEAVYGAALASGSIMVLGTIIGAFEAAAGLAVLGAVAGGVIGYNYGLDSLLYPGVPAMGAGILGGLTAITAVCAIAGQIQENSKTRIDENTVGAVATVISIAAMALSFYSVMSWLGPKTENRNHNTNPARPAAESNHSPLLGQQQETENARLIL